MQQKNVVLYKNPLHTAYRLNRIQRDPIAIEYTSNKLNSYQYHQPIKCFIWS